MENYNSEIGQSGNRDIKIVGEFRIGLRSTPIFKMGRGRNSERERDRERDRERERE